MLEPQLPSRQCYELKLHQPSSLKQLIALKTALGKVRASACYHGSASMATWEQRGQKDEKPEKKEQRTQEWNKAGPAEVCPPVILSVKRGEEEQAVLKASPIWSRATV